jgi:uncharacterized protein (TIGR00251 family)
MSSEPPSWALATGADVILRVHVVPGATRAGIAGFHGDALRVRVTARPVDGAANRQLERVLADALGVRPAAISIDAGAHGREKRVRVQGIAVDEVRRRVVPDVSVDMVRRHR